MTILQQLRTEADINVPTEISTEGVNNHVSNFVGRIETLSAGEEDDESSSSCNSDDLKLSNEGNHDGDSFDRQCEKGSEVMKLARQLKLYKSSKQDEICGDTLQCIQRYTRKIFRQVCYISCVFCIDMIQ